MYNTTLFINFAGMKEIPFIFGRSVSGSHFTDRVQETEMLVNNFTYGVNTIIISPRRYGKTSLVRKAGALAENRNVRVVYVDGFAARSPQEFGVVFANALVRQTSSRLEEIISTARELLSRCHPSVTLGSENSGEITLSLEFKNEEQDLMDILDLPEKIAKRKNCRIVVCIDEFQQIGEFNDTINFQKKLRSVWQHQQLTSYCLYGSKKHMMNELFALPSMPFYNFGQIINLKKIPQEDWVKFILEKFEEIKMPVTETTARRICELTENYSAYVQQLAWLVWTNYDPSEQEKVVEESYHQLIDHGAILFEQQTQDLTDYQLNFLRMILDDKEENYSSMDAVRKYNLGSVANVSRLKKSLIRKELVEVEGRKLILRDPVLKAWLHRQFRW